MKAVEYAHGEITADHKIENTTTRNGTRVVFTPDSEIFKNFHFFPEYVEDQIWNYVYLNSGLTINLNGEKFYSENGLKDLLERKTDVEKIHYPVIHLKGDDIEAALTHGYQYGEEYDSFVNGQYTTQGGTHLAAFREALVRTVREYYKKDFDSSDIRASIIGTISLRIQNPIFEAQTKTRLGSTDMGPDGPTVRILM
jgi:topoisomerase-4 subunit B